MHIDGHYIQFIEEEDEEKLEQESKLEQVNKQLIRLETHPELPEDFDLHVEFYQGELVNHRTRT